MGVIFVAGSYGVGKSTLCEKLSYRMDLPFYSASDLISEVNGEKYGANKTVSNKSANQDILINEIKKISKMFPQIILAGHFCIFDKFNCVEKIPEKTFHNLTIDCILLLECDPERIVKNLNQRDNKNYTLSEMGTISAEENRYACLVAKELSIPLIIHRMKFDDSDVNICFEHLKEIV